MEWLGAERRDGVAMSLGKYHKSPGLVIDHFGLAGWIDDGDLTLAAKHEGPLGRIVPVHFARAAWIDEQMRAGDAGREPQAARRDLRAPSLPRSL